MLDIALAIIVFNFKENLSFRLRKMTKNFILGLFRLVGPKFGQPKLFSKAFCSISEKTNNPVLRK